MKVTNIVVSGLGGQGVLKITDILSEVLFNQGYDVKKSEVHGMSQRGGSVSSEADILAVLDATQTEVALPVLTADGKLITPDSIPVDQLKNPKALNMMLLGALSAGLPELPEEAFIAAINNAFPEKLRALNIEMFQLGRNCGK